MSSPHAPHAPHACFAWLRRLSAVAAVAAVLLTATFASAQAKPSATAANKKGDPLEKKSKNYSIPWVATIACLAAIAVPVAMATRRKWDMPFEIDDEK